MRSVAPRSLVDGGSLWGNCCAGVRRPVCRTLRMRWSVAHSRVALVVAVVVVLAIAFVSMPPEQPLPCSLWSLPPSRYQDAAPLPLAVQRQVAQRRKQMDDAGERDVGGCYVEEEDGSVRWLNVSARPQMVRAVSGALTERPLYASEVVSEPINRMRVFSELPLLWRDANCYLPPRILPSKQADAAAAAAAAPAASPRIPRRLYQTWRRSDSLGPATYWAMRSWIDQNEDFEYNLIDDAQMEQFLEREEYTSDEPHESSEERALTAADVADIRQLLARYWRLKLSAAAVTDLFRLLLLIKHGGVYTDMDSLSEAAMSSWLPPTARSVVYAHSPSPPQWFMAHEAGSPMLLYLLRQILRTVATDYKDDEALLAADLVNISGPQAFEIFMTQKRIDAFCKRKQKEQMERKTAMQRLNGGIRPDALAYADCAAFRSSLLADMYRFASDENLAIFFPVSSTISSLFPSPPPALPSSPPPPPAVRQLSVMRFKDVAVEAERKLRGYLHWNDKQWLQLESLNGKTAQRIRVALVAALLLLLLAWAALRALGREELGTGGKYTTLLPTDSPFADSNSLVDSPGNADR